jgi:hypothetical protein
MEAVVVSSTARESRRRTEPGDRGEFKSYRCKDGRWCGVLNLGWENGRRKRKSYYGATAADVQEQLLKVRGEHTRLASG